MNSVFLLQHSYEKGDSDETKIIGIYSSKSIAEMVVKRFKNLPGFQDYPNDFYIDEYIIDKDNWVEGFVKV